MWLGDEKEEEKKIEREMKKRKEKKPKVKRQIELINLILLLNHCNFF